MSTTCKLSSVADEIAAGDELSTVQLARERNLCLSTVFRWVLRGMPGADGRRVRLEALRFGKRWLTSRAALRRFFGKLPTSNPSSDSSEAPAPYREPRLGLRNPTKSQRAAELAADELRRRHGI